jgi:hypothetical protein
MENNGIIETDIGDGITERMAMNINTMSPAFRWDKGEKSVCMNAYQTALMLEDGMSLDDCIKTCREKGVAALNTQRKDI